MTQNENNLNSDESPFQKGNINFDLLKPHADKEEKIISKEAGVSKKGIFFQNLNKNSLKPYHVVLWIILFLASLSFMVWTFMVGKSFIWLLLMPISLTVMLWSMIMLILIIARPR